MHLIAIIQARMGSTRLPGKVLLTIENRTVLEHVIRRVKSSKLIDDVIVATTIDKEDLKIVGLCASLGVNIYCGSEKDVLDRYYQSAKLFKADNIVRITADCPVIDYRIINNVINMHLMHNSDYTSNTLKESFPDGQDVEVFTFKSIKTAWENATLLSEREHVTPYIRNNPALFKHMNLMSNIDYSNKRWTLDNKEDFEFLRLVYKYLYQKESLFGMQDIIELINERPDIEKINQHIIRNEGYTKSLKADKLFNIEVSED